MSFQVRIHLDSRNRSDFVESALARLQDEAHFSGLDEGSVTDLSLKEFDVGEACANRDWVGQQKGRIEIRFYFTDRPSAESFYSWASKNHESFLDELVEQDYNQKWKASFQGEDIASFWSIRPSWSERIVPSSHRLIRLDPSFGFGFGNHPTTKGCLMALAEISNTSVEEVLDFGSGSGILSVAACLMGAKKVYAVEVDDHARESSRACFESNACADKIQSLKEAPSKLVGSCNLVMANIISGVLRDFAEVYLSALSSNSQLIVSGILDPEMEEMRKFFFDRLEEMNFKQVQMKEIPIDAWNTIYFQLSRR